MNKTILVGRLTRDPKNIGKTSDVAVFTVATSVKTKDGERTDYSDVKVFGNQAANCIRYLSKGSMVAVEGHTTTNSYDNQYKLEIIGDKVDFLDTKKKEQTDPVEIKADFLDNKKPSELTEEELDSLFGGF